MNKIKYLIVNFLSPCSQRRLPVPQLLPHFLILDLVQLRVRVLSLHRLLRFARVSNRRCGDVLLLLGYCDVMVGGGRRVDEEGGLEAVAGCRRGVVHILFYLKYCKF